MFGQQNINYVCLFDFTSCIFFFFFLFFSPWTLLKDGLEECYYAVQEAAASAVRNARLADKSRRIDGNNGAGNKEP